MPRKTIDDLKKKKPISFSIEPKTLANIKRLAKKKKTSASALVNDTFKPGRKG